MSARRTGGRRCFLEVESHETMGKVFHAWLHSCFHFTLGEFVSGSNGLDFFASAPPLPAPGSVTSDAPIKPVRAVPGHAGWILLDVVDLSLRIRLNPEQNGIFSDKTQVKPAGPSHRRVRWIPVVSQRRSVFRATP